MGFIAYAVMGIDVMAPSFYHSIFNGKMVMSMRIYLPVLDETQAGLAILVVINCVTTTLGVFNEISFDCLMYVIFANVPMVSSIITGQLDDLKEALLDPDNTLDSNKYRFRTFILMTLKYNQ